MVDEKLAQLDAGGRMIVDVKTYGRKKKIEESHNFSYWGNKTQRFKFNKMVRFTHTAPSGDCIEFFFFLWIYLH